MIVRVPRPASLPAASERYVVVEASAGTGKTYFLEHRVADLVIGGADLAQILLVTFTDKAVAELRMRIRDLLDRLSRAETSSDADNCWELDDAARLRLRAAVTAFDHAPIFTIHGFCHRVLIEDAFAARRLFQQQQVADEVAFDAAYGALLRERFAVESPDKELLAAYLQHVGTTDTLRDLLLQCSRADARARRRFDPAAVQAIVETLRAECGTAEQRQIILETTNWTGQQRYAPAWLELVADALDGWDGTPIGALAVCSAVAEKADKLATRVTSPTLVRALEATQKTMSLEEAIAIELLPRVIERIASDKAERGMFDYKDMLELVRDALRGPRGGELANRLRTRTPWVMIDEFQDTDLVQWEIFRTVWLDEQARGLTIVGDPKQAIYGFRGADVATYLDARDVLLKLGAHRVSLDENRRSVAPLVTAVNTLINQSLNELLDKDIRYEAPVRAAGDLACDDARPPITVFALDAETGADKAELASAIGAEIERLRARPPAWQHRGTRPAFSLGQVMVLTRANKESSAIAAALRARGLACALVESEGLFETREAAELCAVLAAIAAPRDRSARLRALRTRFFDVRWTELMRVVDAPDHHPAIARLFDWAALAVRREYETLFRRLLDDSRYAARALVVGGGERAVVNTMHLIELLLEDVARSRGDLHELVSQLQRWIDDFDDVEDDRDVQRAETDGDAIRVLTIHKAKGLEAPYVFIYGAASKSQSKPVHTLRDASGRVLVIGRKLTPELETAQQAENERLAYVALTRAQVRMYLPLYTDKQCDKHSTYAQIQRCLRPLVGRDPAFEVVPVVAADDPLPPPDALASFDVPAPPVVAELAPIERGGLAMWSYTRLAHDVDIARSAGPNALEIARAELDAEPDVKTIDAELPPGELPPGSDAGLFLHDVLEQVDLRDVRDCDAVTWAARPEVAQLLADRGRERGIDRASFAHGARLVHHTLTAPLTFADGRELPPLVHATALAREVEFAYPIPGAELRGLVKGFIDALVAYDGDLWVLDYKSDRLADPAHARAHALEHYGVQARLYALAADKLRGARRLRGVLFTFLRHAITVPVEVDADTLAGYARWLEGLR